MSKVGCKVNDLRRRGSAVRDAQSYANRHGACSNRNALPVCVIRLSRQSAADRGCRLWIVESAAFFQSRGIFIRLRNSRRPAISSGQALTTATLESLCAQQSAPALVTACSSGAHSFAWAARGYVPGPAHRMLGRADGHGCRTCGAGRWPWRGTAAVINPAIDGPLVLAGPGPAALY